MTDIRWRISAPLSDIKGMPATTPDPEVVAIRVSVPTRWHRRVTVTQPRAARGGADAVGAFSTFGLRVPPRTSAASRSAALRLSANAQSQAHPCRPQPLSKAVQAADAGAEGGFTLTGAAGGDRLDGHGETVAPALS